MVIHPVLYSPYHCCTSTVRTLHVKLAHVELARPIAHVGQGWERQSLSETMQLKVRHLDVEGWRHMVLILHLVVIITYSVDPAWYCRTYLYIVTPCNV